MANTFSAKSNTWNADTAGALTTAKVKIKNIRWAGGSSGDVCILKDASGAIFFKSIAESDNWNDEQLFESWVVGITVDQIDHGNLFIVYW